MINSRPTTPGEASRRWHARPLLVEQCWLPSSTHLPHPARFMAHFASSGRAYNKHFTSAIYNQKHVYELVQA